MIKTQKVVFYILFLMLNIILMTSCYNNKNEWVKDYKMRNSSSDEELFTTNDSLFYIFTNFDLQSKTFFTEFKFLTNKKYKIVFFNIKLYDQKDTLNYDYLINRDWGKNIILFDSLPERFRYTGVINDLNKDGQYGGFNKLKLNFTFKRKTEHYHIMPDTILYIIDFEYKDELYNTAIKGKKNYIFYHNKRKVPIWL